MIDLLKTVEHLITKLPIIYPENTKYMSHAACLQEFRTISLGVPRRSGKTTTLAELNKRYSSILLSKYILQSNQCNILPNVRGYNNQQGLKYRALFLDEYTEVPKSIYQYIVTDLSSANIIEKDFFIVNLYTPKAG